MSCKSFGSSNRERLRAINAAEAECKKIVYVRVCGRARDGARRVDLVDSRRVKTREREKLKKTKIPADPADRANSARVRVTIRYAATIDQTLGSGAAAGTETQRNIISLSSALRYYLVFGGGGGDRACREIHHRAINSRSREKSPRVFPVFVHVAGNIRALHRAFH